MANAAGMRFRGARIAARGGTTRFCPYSSWWRSLWETLDSEDEAVSAIRHLHRVDLASLLIELRRGRKFRTVG